MQYESKLIFLLEQLTAKEIANSISKVPVVSKTGEIQHFIFLCSYHGLSSRKRLAKSSFDFEEILQDQNVSVKDVAGGLDQWSKKIEPSFPRYWHNFFAKNHS